MAPEALSAAPDGEASAGVAARVVQARERQVARQGCSNALLDTNGLDAHALLAGATADFLHAAARRLGWSGRSVHRVQRVARSVADLAGAADIQIGHVAEAIQLRRALPGG